MSLSDADLHWIPMNRTKFDQLRRMFDANAQHTRSPCDKCTSPRIRYTTAENVTALSQIRSLLKPVDPHDNSSTSSRSRTTSEDSVEMRIRSHPQQNRVVVIDPLLCAKNSHKNNGLMLSNTLISDGCMEKFKCDTIGEITLHESVDEAAKRCKDTNINNTTSVDNNIMLVKSAGIIKQNDNAVDGTELINHEVSNHVSLQNGGIVENGDIHENGGIVENGDIHENGGIDNSVDEDSRSSVGFLELVNNTSAVLSKEREYFLDVLDNATTVSDEAGGRVMAACGKANLLLTSKFKQYRGLCVDYEKTRQMTSDDIQGFWDLISLQVADVNKMFKSLRVLEQENWVIPKSPMPAKKGINVTKTPHTPVSTKKKRQREKTPAQIARDEQRRQMLAAKKEEMRQLLKHEGIAPQIIITS